MTDVGFTFLENSLRTEDFSLALLEDGQEPGISRGFCGKRTSNETFGQIGCRPVWQFRRPKNDVASFALDLCRFALISPGLKKSKSRRRAFRFSHESRDRHAAGNRSEEH